MDTVRHQPLAHGSQQVATIRSARRGAAGPPSTKRKKPARFKACPWRSVTPRKEPCGDRSTNGRLKCASDGQRLAAKRSAPGRKFLLVANVSQYLAQIGDLVLQPLNARGLRSLRLFQRIAHHGQFLPQARLGLKALGDLLKRAVHAPEHAIGQGLRLAQAKPAGALRPAQKGKASGEVALQKVQGPVGVAHAYSLPQLNAVPERTHAS